MSSFVFSYVSICPAISIIISDKKIVNTNENKEKLLEWLSNLFKLFNIIMKTNRYIITEDDLSNSSIFFKRSFNQQIWPYTESALKSPKLWGRYIWSLLHIISLFWTPSTSYYVYYLIKNASDILPCAKCKSDYIKIFDDKDICNKLNFISSIEESVNFVITLRQDINKAVYNKILIPNRYTFTDIYNYIKPLIEPNYNMDKTPYIKRQCNCKK